MKKSILLFAAAFAMSGFVNAQTGSWVLSGNVGFSSTTYSNTVGGTKQPDITSSTVTVLPSVAYYVSDNMAVGLMIGINNTKTEHSTENTKSSDKINAFQAGPFLKMDFMKDDKFNAYGTLGINYSSGTDEMTSTYTDPLTGISTSTSSKSDMTQFGAGVGMGAQYHLTSKCSLTATWGLLSYNSTDEKPDSGNAYEYKTSTFGLTLNPLNILFGLNFHFGGTAAK
jgi:outer membrane protein